jgi:hypothetical protein
VTNAGAWRESFAARGARLICRAARPTRRNRARNSGRSTRDDTQANSMDLGSLDCEVCGVSLAQTHQVAATTSRRRVATRYWVPRPRAVKQHTKSRHFSGEIEIIRNRSSTQCCLRARLWRALRARNEVSTRSRSHNSNPRGHQGGRTRRSWAAIKFTRFPCARKGQKSSKKIVGRRDHFGQRR